jgi:hypothetical protein
MWRFRTMHDLSPIVVFRQVHTKVFRGCPSLLTLQVTIGHRGFDNALNSMVCELLVVFMTYVSNYKKLCEWDDTKNRGRRRWTLMQKGLCMGTLRMLGNLLIDLESLAKGASRWREGRWFRLQLGGSQQATVIEARPLGTAYLRAWWWDDFSNLSHRPPWCQSINPRSFTFWDMSLSLLRLVSLLSLLCFSMIYRIIFYKLE